MNKKPNGIGQAGAIINILVAIIMILAFAFLWFAAAHISEYDWFTGETYYLPVPAGLAIFYSIAIIWNLLSFIFNVMFIAKGKTKVVAGIMGLFTSLLGGIFVLVSEVKEKE